MWHCHGKDRAKIDRGMPLLDLSHALGAGGGGCKRSLPLSTMALNESLLLEKMALAAGSHSAGERDQENLPTLTT